MNQPIKYPRTYHLPWSPGVTKDDKIITSLDTLINSKEIVITEKMDGENTTLYRDYIHNRSLDYIKPHPSRGYIKELHSVIKQDIPPNWRICGENLYAKHSIHYTNLPTYFLVFSIWNEYNQCLSWGKTLEYCSLLNLQPVPIIYTGPWNIDFIKSIKLNKDQEGYVIRVESSFHYDQFSTSIVKYVRANHVTTSSHWLNQVVIPNRLMK
jgi:hypothetical protein